MSRPPLAGLRVVTVSQFGAGPFGTQVLADLGADVIKIEDPTVGGDIARYVPPFRDGSFGANGLAFNRAQSTLFVNNTGNDTVVKIPVNPNGSAGTPAVFVNSVNGADGLIIDEHDNLWIAANQADEIVVINPSGRTIAKLGDFNGLDHDGAPIGLLFPASLVFSGPFVYVTNLAIDLRLFDDPTQPTLTNGTGDSPWTADVKVHTISRIPAFLPLPGLSKH
jgi:DNA-binding beta-propeller fold protein YncE